MAIDIMEIMRLRHSVRQYTDAPAEPDKREALGVLAGQLNREHGLHIQLIWDEPRCFSSFMARYGNFADVRNYIALVGKKAENLDEMLGYCGEVLVLKAQQLGLNTCWVALSHGRSGASVLSGEKQVCLISLGYGRTQGAPHKSRPLAELCSPSSEDDMPDWFRSGMQAVLLAPTAMNQQKFFFRLTENGGVQASCDRGFYTKLDLGIAKCHFELGSGRKIIG